MKCLNCFGENREGRKNRVIIMLDSFEENDKGQRTEQ